MQTTNGKNGHASGVNGANGVNLAVRAANAVASAPEDVVAGLESWIATTVTRGRAKAFELVLRSSFRADGQHVQTWDVGELLPAALAQAAYDAAVLESHHAEGATSFLLVAYPTGDRKPFAVPPPNASHRTGTSQEPATGEGLLALLMVNLRGQTDTAQKYTMAAFEALVEQRTLEIGQHKDDRRDMLERWKVLEDGYLKQISQQSTLIERLVKERVENLSAFLDVHTRSRELEIVAEQESRRSKMKEDMWATFFKPAMPLLLGKVARAIGAAPPSPPKPSAPSAKGAATPSASEDAAKGTPGATEAAAAPAPSKVPDVLTREQSDLVIRFMFEITDEEMVALAKALHPDRLDLLMAFMKSLHSDGGASP